MSCRLVAWPNDDDDNPPPQLLSWSTTRANKLANTQIHWWRGGETVTIYGLRKKTATSSSDCLSIFYWTLFIWPINTKIYTPGKASTAMGRYAPITNTETTISVRSSRRWLIVAITLDLLRLLQHTRRPTEFNFHSIPELYSSFWGGCKGNGTLYSRGTGNVIHFPQGI